MRDDEARDLGRRFAAIDPWARYPFPPQGLHAYFAAKVPGSPRYALRAGDVVAGAIKAFRHAQELERALPYTEPAYWHRPVAHLLGAAYLEASQPAEAEAVYRDSLHHYRRDGWALMGLANALDAQGKGAEAAKAKAELADAWKRADTKIETSRL